jgi:hypothetical protein
MINEKLKARMAKDRPNTTITMRIPVDVVDLMKEIAPMRGFTGYQVLLKSYISEGLRRDEAELELEILNRAIEALRKRGVKESIIREALAEAKGSATRRSVATTARPQKTGP